MPSIIKNYLVVTKTGKSAYSTEVKVYKITNNTPCLLGELHNQPEDCALRYVCTIMANRLSRIDVEGLYRNGDINIHQIKL